MRKAAIHMALVLLLSGCAQTLDKSIASCYSHSGRPAFTQDGSLTRFECK